MYLTLRKAAQELGIDAKILRKYAEEGRIETAKSAAGHRLYRLECSLRGVIPRSCICYCRAASAPQLEKQMAHMRKEYPNAEIVKDAAGSGLNVTRTGLRTILLRVLSGYPMTVVVAESGFDDSPETDRAIRWMLMALKVKLEQL